MAATVGDLAALVAPLRAAPQASALVFDFDGTLAAVVDDPAAAVPLPGVADHLAALADAYAVVAVVSGRPVAFLAGHLPASVQVSGLYGLESVIGGLRTDHGDAARWRPVVAAAVVDLEAAAGPGGRIEGATVEPKGLSLTVHVRTQPELQEAVERLANEVGTRHGLEARAAKMSVELHPPIDADKGTAIEALVAGCANALVVGDDLGDLPAFEALRVAQADGRLERAIAVAVGGPELPASVADAADVVLAGPGAVVELLERLVP